MTSLTLELKSADIELNDKQFYRLCQANRDLRLERTAEGRLIIMPPTGWETGNRNFRIAQQLGNWADADGTGIGFDSSTGFRLPNGAVRSPDAAWVKRARLEALNPKPEEFLPLCPDFVIELRSASDALPMLQEKMREYLSNGLRFGWLIDLQGRQVEIYRSDRAVEVVAAPMQLSAEPVLPGFSLDLTQIL